MQKAKEVKIRDILKTIFDSYKSVSDFVFTTFDFDLDFFEEHIITFLMGNERKISTIGELKATNEWIRDNNLCVYYDKNALKVGTSCITLPSFSQFVKKGVFHPKVVVIHGEQKNGEKAAHLIVSSCNLTVSGYGRNLEAFSYIKVETSQVAKSLSDFLDKLREDDKERHKVTIDYLQKTAFRNDDSVEFFWNYDNNERNLLDKISELPDGDLEIVSPYYDENGPSGLLQEIKGCRKVKVFPAIDGEKYNIHHSEYVNLKEKGIEFAEIRIDDKKQRFVHAKIIQKGQFSIVGSYNFTTVALKGGNAEAALIIPLSERIVFSECTVDESKFLPDTEKLINKDTMDQAGNNVHITFVVDWGRNALTITKKQSQNNPRLVYGVKIDGLSDSKKEWIVENSLEEELDDVTKIAVLRHKQFSVYYNNHLCSKGIIVEINWEGYRPEIVCNSLDETISEWYNSNEQINRKEHKYDLRSFSDSEEDGQLERIESRGVDSSGDLFDNYYLVAFSLGRLCEEMPN